MKTIGLTFDLNEGWMGGSYYIRNLISALNTLPKSEQPCLALLSSLPDSVRFAQEAGYQNMLWITPKQFAARPEDFPFDALFPWADPRQAYRTLSWIPDFQELHLPYYFSPTEIASRRHHHRLRFATAGLVVSSEDVKNDVARFYPGECDNVTVVHFASFDRFDESRLGEVKATYDITGPYVMCANQVWVHKNHILVIKALAILKARGVDVTVCFTGSESDYRVTGYNQFLRQMAAEWGVAQNVRFLGFIPRDDQLNLMKGAAYIIQPSLFEGWSTVIEDAKAMNQFVVASDLGVHLEQLEKNRRFFPRHNPDALAYIMQEFAATPPKVEGANTYVRARQSFGRDFIQAVNSLMPKSAAGKRPRAISARELADLSAANMATLS